MTANNDAAPTSPDAVLHFWFDETPERLWFVKDDAFDARLHERFGALHARAARCELWHWRTGARGRLAEIIVLDQFSRNLLRRQPQAFASDPLALALAQELVAQGLDAQLAPRERAFAYMPYMHSESLLVQQQSLRLFEALGQQNNLDFARRHEAIVARFGRYPHRNAVLGRASTEEEQVFLQQPGSSF